MVGVCLPILLSSIADYLLFRYEKSTLLRCLVPIFEQLLSFNDLVHKLLVCVKIPLIFVAIVC